MSFWELDNCITSQGGIFDQGGCRFTPYSEILGSLEGLERRFSSSRKLLIAICASNTLNCIQSYLAALRERHTVLLIPGIVSRQGQSNILASYRPDFIVADTPFGPVPEGFRRLDADLPGMELMQSASPDETGIHPDAALLLTTSGATGSPKHVRLSYSNLESNAVAIRESLELSPDERPMCYMPMAYAFGLSIINSHLAAGATLVLSHSGIAGADFWRTFESCECTSFAGVPYAYQILQRLKLEALPLRSLRTMTQAGGRLACEVVQQFGKWAERRSARFVVMYGQTEATARMTFLPPHRVLEKPASVGVAVPGGRVTIESRDDIPQSLGGEIVYQGPNVMMGYSVSRTCLAQGDTQGDTLRTGDTGSVDAEGYLYITGRLRRLIKVFGQRINLDDAEVLVRRLLDNEVACIGSDDHLRVFVLGREAGCCDQPKQREKIAHELGLHHSAIEIVTTESLPRTYSGKIDYSRLALCP